jgi:hypothetical protein
MRRLAALALSLSFLPAVPAHAASSMTTTWVVERVSPRATTLTVRGGAGARDGEYAMAAVASATVDGRGTLTGAEGALFFGIAPDGETVVSTPAGDYGCHDVPNAGTACALHTEFGVIGFAVWWDDVTFNRVFVVLHGRNRSIDLGEHGSPGWRARRWTGAVRVVTDDIVVGPAAAGRAPSAFTYAESYGGRGGSVAIGHLPCLSAGYTNAGSGAARLLGGEHDVVGTCADFAPPAAFASGSTEWAFDGAAGGVSDTPARLVVIDGR